MKITLITVGKIKEKYLKDAISEYSKRLSRYCKLEIIEVAYSLTKFLIENYRERFLKRYKLDDNEVNEILNNKEQEENQNIYEIMQLIGKKRGAIMSGGYIDDEKTSKIIIEDFRTGKLGRITIEKC